MIKLSKKIIKYLRDLIDRTNCTSMSRFLALNVVISTLVAWAFNSVWLGYMVEIPESVLQFNALIIGGRTIQGISDAVGVMFNKNKEKECNE